MQYLGGKHYSAKGIANYLAPLFDSPSVNFYEPFCGALHASLAIVPHVRGQSFLSDGFKDLIDLWVAVRDGFLMPAISQEEYTSLRYDTPSPKRTAAGFGLSFSGKWFGSFIRDRPEQSAYPVQALNRSFIRRRSLLSSVTLTHSDYSEIHPNPGDVVYCDPPYANTTSPGDKRPFDSTLFWEWVRHLSVGGVKVFTSEYRAPSDFEPVWESTIPSRLKTSGHHKSGVTHYATEQLWRLRS